jgi:anti-sigma regulatory factor (Ser/Thr protein kinase)
MEFGHLSWPATAPQLIPIQSAVQRWLLPVRLTPSAADGLVCATCEAARNAVEHAYLPATEDDTVDVIFWTEVDAVCIEVVDHGRWRIPPVDLTGRGIPMMLRAVDSVAIHYNSRGTQVLLRSHQTPRLGRAAVA